MFGDMVGVETGALVSLDEFEPRFVVFVQWKIVAIQMVENSEIHTRPDIS